MLKEEIIKEESITDNLSDLINDDEELILDETKRVVLDMLSNCYKVIHDTNRH